MATYRSSLRVRALAVVNGKPVGYNSPTETLKDDIVTEGGTCIAHVTYIDKICLVDDAGTERDCTTQLNYEDRTPDYVLVKGSIQATAAYTVAKIRAYSGDKLYFETDYSVALNEGDVLDVTYQISATMTCSLSGSVTQQSCNPNGYVSLLLKKLIGAAGNNLCLKKANLRFYSEAEGQYVIGLSIDLSLSYDTAQNKVTGSGSGTSTTEFNAEYLEYQNNESPALTMVEQWFSQTLPIYRDTVVNVSYELTVQ